MHKEVKSIDELPDLAKEVLAKFESKRVFLLKGDLGAGKTTFIKVLCEQLGVEEDMSSPTFSLINEYKGANGPVYHMDLYRLKDEMEAYDIGLEDILDSGSYCFIEWPEKIYNLLSDDFVRVSIHVRDNLRIFNIELP